MKSTAAGVLRQCSAASKLPPATAAMLATSDPSHVGLALRTEVVT
jgi:hypothetical protein